MKRIRNLFFIVMIGIFLSMTLANAEEYGMKRITYTVVKGDTLSLIGQRFGLDWQKIADSNNISEPYWIFPGDILILNRYQPNNFKSYTVVKGDTLSLIGQRFGLDWQKIADLNDIVEPYLIFPGDVIYLYKIKAIEVKRTSPVVVIAPARTKLRKKVKIEKPAVMQEEQLQVSSKLFLPTGKVIPAKNGLSSFNNLSQKKSGVSLTLDMDMLDIYSYGGYSEKTHKNAGGSYAGIKAKVKPISVYHHGIEQKFGIFVLGERNNGYSDNYDYDGSKLVAGLTTGIETQNYDFSFDLGLGKKESDGTSGLYKSHQKDTLFYLSSYFKNEKRRKDGKTWFPQYNFGFWTNAPLHSTKDSSWNGKKLNQDPWDVQSYELSFRQDVYDAKFNDWTLTPLVKFSYGHSWGDGTSNYGILPGLKLSYKYYDLLTISTLGYTEELGGDNDKVKWFGLFIDIGNVIKAIKSSRISKYEPRK